MSSKPAYNSTDVIDEIADKSREGFMQTLGEMWQHVNQEMCDEEPGFRSIVFSAFAMSLLDASVQVMMSVGALEGECAVQLDRDLKSCVAKAMRASIKTAT